MAEKHDLPLLPYASLETVDFRSSHFLEISKKLFEEIRKLDGYFEEVEAEAKAYIRFLTSHNANNLGSFPLFLNLFDSDLDLAIGVTHEERKRILEILQNTLEFRGERYATSITKRHLFRTKIEKVYIDINVMILEDYERLSQAFSTAQNDLDMNLRVLHVGKKFQLKSREMKTEYDEFKLEIYRKIAPGFLWIPDYKIRQMLEACRI
jgi:hypothetical protein